jgi:S1-C subfamily serine protease
MNRRATLLLTAAVIVGLGLGSTVLRSQVPVSDAQQVAGVRSPAQSEALARLQNETNTIDIVKKYEPGLVYISTEQTIQSADPFGMMMGGSQRVEGVGSGFFVNAAGDILTNFHVVRGADAIQIRLLGNKQTYSARVIGRAPQYDLALIRPSKLPANLVRPIPLGNSDTLAVGQKTIAMGAPFGLDFSVTEGIVSATNRRIPIGFSGANDQGQGIAQNAIQTDAAINPGNSGGPLLNSAGQVIGINTQIISPASSGGEGQSAGVGFAIPINTAKNLLTRLQQAGGKAVYAPRIGVVPGFIAVQGTQTGPQTVALGLSALTTAAKQQFGLPATGLVIREVSRNTPASKAGLVGGTRTQAFQGGQAEISLGGDVVTAVNGQPVDSLEDLQSGLIDRKVGDTVTLTLVRGGKTRQVKLTLDQAAFQQGN